MPPTPAVITPTAAPPSHPPSPVVPTPPRQTAFRVAQHGLTRAAIVHDPHLELDFDESTGRYRLSVLQRANRF